jgi:hypothetical protein
MKLKTGGIVMKIIRWGVRTLSTLTPVWEKLFQRAKWKTTLLQEYLIRTAAMSKIHWTKDSTRATWMSYPETTSSPRTGSSMI